MMTEQSANSLAAHSDEKIRIVSVFTSSFMRLQQDPEELMPISNREFKTLMALVGFATLVFGVIVHLSWL